MKRAAKAIVYGALAGLAFPLLLILGVSAAPQKRQQDLPPFSATGDVGKVPFISTGGTVTWATPFTFQVVDVVANGGDNTGSVDVGPLVNSLIQAFSATSSDTGGILFFKRGTYRVSTTIHVTRQVVLWGEGGWGQVSTKLVPDTNVIAVEFDSPGTAPDGGNGEWSSMRDIGVSYASQTTGDWQSNHTYSIGNTVRAPTGTPNHNVVFVVATGGTSGGSVPATFATAASGAIVTDNTVSWRATRMAGILLFERASLSHIAVLNSPGVGIQIEGFSAGSPVTNSNGWNVRLAKVNSSALDGFYVHGTDAQAGNANAVDCFAAGYFCFYDDSEGSNVYDTCQADSSGLGPYANTGGVENLYTNCYSESGDQPPSKLFEPARVINGTHGAGFTASTTAEVTSGRSHTNGANTFTAGGAQISFFGTNQYINAAMTFGDSTHQYSMYPEQSYSGDDCWMYNNLTQGSAHCMTNGNHTRGAGYSYFPNGILFQDQRDNFRSMINFLNSAPGSGSWGTSDIMFNSAPSSIASPYGWRNIAGGSPGTWVAMQPCDTTGCTYTGTVIFNAGETIAGTLILPSGILQFTGPSTNNLVIFPTGETSALVFEDNSGRLYETFNSVAPSVTISQPLTVSSGATFSGGTVTVNVPETHNSTLTCNNGATVSGTLVLPSGTLQFTGASGSNFIVFPTGEGGALVMKDNSGAVYETFNSLTQSVVISEPLTVSSAITAANGLNVTGGTMVVSVATTYNSSLTCNAGETVAGTLTLPSGVLKFTGTSANNLVVFPTGEASALIFEDNAGNVYTTFNSSTIGVTISEPLTASSGASFTGGTVVSNVSSTFNGTGQDKPFFATDQQTQGMMTIGTSGYTYTWYAQSPIAGADCFKYQNADATTPFCTTNAGHARGAGYTYFPDGILFQNQRDNFRSMINFNSGPPGSGSWGTSDIMFNSNPSSTGSVYGWRNIAGGSPGTWSVMSPCDTTGCSYTGAVTLGAGATFKGNTNVTTAQFAITPPANITVLGTTGTVNWNNGNNEVVDVTNATGTVTLTFLNAVTGSDYHIELIEGSTARQISWPTITWNTTVAPVFSASTTYNVNCYFDGTTYFCTPWPIPRGPYAVYQLSASTGMNGATWNPIGWTQTNTADATSVVSLTSNGSGTPSTRITVSTAGLYQVSAILTFTNAVTGSIGLIVGKDTNGSITGFQGDSYSENVLPNTNLAVNATKYFSMAANDYVEVFGINQPNLAGTSRSLLGTTGATQVQIFRLGN